MIVFKRKVMASQRINGVKVELCTIEFHCVSLSQYFKERDILLEELRHEYDGLECFRMDEVV
jgi:hypothetical protein